MSVIENFTGFTTKNWQPAEFKEVLESKAGDWICYTRDTYMNRAEFLKKVKESNGAKVSPQRRKICCVVKEVDFESGSIKVESIPRKFKDEAREHRVMSWQLKDGMRGSPKFYIRVPGEQQPVAKKPRVSKKQTQ
jgi:hypothetical protein